MTENRENSLISDVISCIIDIRKKKQCDNLTFEADFSNTISALLILESHFDRYEELSLIRKLKSILLSYLIVFSDNVCDLNDHLQIDSFSTSMGIKRKIVERNLIHQSDIEPLNKQIFAEISTTIAALSDAEIINSFTTSQKKVKANHNFLLDLDSYPLLEPLENSLSVLRRDSGNNDALKKIIFTEVEDFIDHPQWLELIELLQRSLLTNSVLAVHIVIKFATRLRKHQAIDALRLLAHYFHDLFCTPLLTLETMRNVSSVMHMTDIQKVQIDALIICLSSVTTHGLSGSELDEIIYTLFVVLAEGNLIVKISDVDVPVDIFDIMVGLNKDFSFIKQWCINFVPLSILYHAISSRFIFKLISHIRELGQTSNLTSFNNHYQNNYPRRLLLSSIMFLELLGPFAANGYVKQICCDDKNIVREELLKKSVSRIEFYTINNKLMKVVRDFKNLFDNSNILTCCSDPCPIFELYFSTIVVAFIQSIHHLVLEAETNANLIKSLISLTIKFLPYCTIGIRKFVFESYSKVFQELIDLRPQELLYFPLSYALINYFTFQISSSDDLHGLFHLVKILSDWYLLSYSAKDMSKIKNLLTLQTYLIRHSANNDSNEDLMNDFVIPTVSSLLAYLLSKELVDSTTDSAYHIFIISIVEYEYLANLIFPLLDPMIQKVFSRLLIHYIHNNCEGVNILDIMHKIISSKKCSTLLSDMAFETLQLFLTDNMDLFKIEFCIEDLKLLKVLRIIYEIGLVDCSGSINKLLHETFNTGDAICDPYYLLKSLFLNDTSI